MILDKKSPASVPWHTADELRWIICDVGTQNSSQMSEKRFIFFTDEDHTPPQTHSHLAETTKTDRVFEGIPRGEMQTLGRPLESFILEPFIFRRPYLKYHPETENKFI